MAAGFTKLREKDAFHLEQGGKYFFTRNETALVAFVVGGAYEAGNGFNLIAAHSDSPNFKVKPVYDIRVC